MAIPKPRENRDQHTCDWQWLWAPTVADSARIRALAQSLPYLLLRRNVPSIPADAGRIEARIAEGKQWGLAHRPTTITRRLLGVFHPCPLFYLLSVDNEVAAKEQRRLHRNAEDPTVLAADLARMQWERDRWTAIAEHALAIRELLDDAPPPDEQKVSYYHVGFAITDWQAPCARDGKIGIAGISARNVVGKIADDAQEQAKRAREYVDEIEPRLVPAKMQRNPRASQITKERLAILHGIMSSADPAWTTGDVADALMISSKDWTGKDANGDAIGPPCPGLVARYLYDPEQPRRTRAADDRRRKFIAWIEKNVRRVDL